MRLRMIWNSLRLPALVFLAVVGNLIAFAADPVDACGQWQQVIPGVMRTKSSPHAHAIVDGDRCILIDAPFQVTPRSLPPTVKSCDLVLLTHHHRDTCANVAAYVAANVPVRASTLAQAYLSPEGVAAYWEKSMPLATP